MNGINARVGARIRLYRRAKKLTLIQLSAMIHKSKATLSKYETGDIAIDVETLYDIAAALDMPETQAMLMSFGFFAVGFVVIVLVGRRHKKNPITYEITNIIGCGADSV